MKLQKYILDYLLDKYGKSKHYQGKAKINRRVSMPFSPQKFPLYWEADKPYVKEAIHQVVDELVEQDIVSVQWVPFEKGNIIQSLSLNLAAVNSAYKLARRVPKEVSAHTLDKQLVDIADRLSTSWLKEFIKDCLIELREKKNIPAVLAKEKDLLLEAVLGMEDLKGEEILERVFSLKYLGDSKLFQKSIRKRLAGVAREYYFKDTDLSDDDVMAELGINKTSEEVLIYGAVSFWYQGREIDYTPFPFGGILDSQFIKAMSLSKLQADRVVTIENKANYHYLVRKGPAPATVLIYLGGFPGPYKRMLLEKIYAYQKAQNMNIAFWHWGDIDVGGFKIFRTLEKTVPLLQPVLMDKNTLRENVSYTEQVEKSYLRQIEKLLENKKYERFRDTLTVMLAEKIRLEQEALLINDKLLYQYFIGKR